MKSNNSFSAADLRSHSSRGGRAGIRDASSLEQDPAGHRVILSSRLERVTR